MEFPETEILNCKNPYIILGMEIHASQEEIKRAYRSLALKWHPDRNDMDKKLCHEMFIKVAWAYEILKDPEKKRQYDKFGTIDGEGEHLEDILQKFNQEFQEEDLSGVRSQNFKKSVKSALNGNVKDLCDKCKGYGIIESAHGFFISKETCSKCKGNGYVDAPPIEPKRQEPENREYNPYSYPPFLSKEFWWG